MKCYRAKLTQSGENDPTPIESLNTLGFSVSWRRVVTDTGSYAGTFSGTVSEGEKIFCYAPVRDNSGDVTTGSAAVFTFDRSGDAEVRVNCYGTPEDGSLQHRELEGAIFVAFDIYP